MEEKKSTEWAWETPNENDANENAGDMAFKHLFDCIQDFTNVVCFLEMEIERLGLRNDSHDPVPDMNGRTHRGMWMSVMTVAHFNLGIALELMLKLLLWGNGKGNPWGHELSPLYCLLPSSVRQELESTYQDSRSALSEGYGLVGFCTKPPPPPPLPQNRNLATLKDFFEYFDQDVRLSGMRYSYELIEQQKVRQYLENLSVFTTFLDRVMGNITRYIAPESSAENRETGTGLPGAS
ncbi:MAG: hypothetical protein OXF39_03995 [Nitrospira sp.]|nr:hypothetical protein [Nitrospira sp.]